MLATKGCTRRIKQFCRYIAIKQQLFSALQQKFGIKNCFFFCSRIVPFDEDDKDKAVWFLDHDYLDSMYGMFKKVNARERVVGWYHTGPKLHQNDIAINELIRRYCPNSILVIIDAKPKDLGLPTEAYISVEEVHEDGTPTSKTFEHVPSEIGAEEAEEVGVEHLLRDIKDTTVGSLSQKITNQLLGLKGINAQIRDIKNYLMKVRNLPTFVICGARMFNLFISSGD